MSRGLIFRGVAWGATGFAAVAFGSVALADNRPSGQRGVDAFFESADVDGDDQITREEHATAAREKFENMDADADGMLSTDEMAPPHAAMGKGGAQKSKVTATEAMKKMDSDGDGRLSLDEHAEAAANKFGEWDANDDGSLTRQELAAGYKNARSGKKR